MAILFKLKKLHPLYEVLQMLSWPWKAMGFPTAFFRWEKSLGDMFSKASLLAW